MPPSLQDRLRSLWRARRFRRAALDESGYSLVEVLIVIVIIGILALLALPKLTSLITRAKTTEAKTMLAHLHTLQQTYRYENDGFTTDLAALGYEPAKLTSEGGTARYRLAVEEAGAASYTATATAVVDFDGDGVINVWTVNAEGVVRERTPD